MRDDEGLVTLMTLHNAKGLEFPIVFIIGCEDGRVPARARLDEGSLEEERRLAYVGITRAMRDLYITYARRRNVFGAQQLRHALALHRRDPARAHRPAGARRRLAVRARPGRIVVERGGGHRRGRPARDGRGFGVGDDVVHAQFGEGVVTGVEPGGIVVVRFAEDGSERKLMADYAPIKRR